MAQINLESWDVAELFGLRYVGSGEVEDKYGDTSWMYKFDFHGKLISKYEGCYDSEDEAKESVAHDLLLEIGSKLSKIIGDI